MPTDIQMLDLKRQYNNFRNEINAAVLAVLESGQYILGPNVQAFEAEAAQYCGTRYAIGVASGTDALHLALLACDIHPGDEVITTPFTFAATIEAILYIGAKPVLVDIDSATFNIDATQIEAAITDRTKAIVPVHLYGQSADLTRIEGICRQYDLRLIEDCAQSFGAEHNGRKTGAFGDCGCFSFYPSKNLGGFGDGGIILTNNEDTADRIRILRNHGSTRPHHHVMLGYNSRLDELQAAILRVYLKNIDQLNQQRRINAMHYTTRLENTVTVPTEYSPGSHVYNLYTIRTPYRDRLAAQLKQHGIASAVHYPVPLHFQEIFKAYFTGKTYPVAEQAANEVLSLPLHPYLQENEIDAICSAVAGFMETASEANAVMS